MWPCYSDHEFANLVWAISWIPWDVEGWQLVETLVRGVGVHRGVTFNFGSAKVCLPAIFETSFSCDKNIWIAATDYYMHFYIIVLFSIDSCSPINKFYSLIVIILLINAVILLLYCLVLILYLYIHFLSLRWYFLYLNIIWSFVYLTVLTLLWKYPNLCTVSLLLYLMVLKTIFPSFGVQASLMLCIYFLFHKW